jgi:hypothetical protein
MDWTVAAFEAAAPATVAIADADGNILGSGFWVNGFSIVTAWHVVGRESLGIRVIITVAGTVPTSLDGVLTFAIPGLDLALVSVNPDLYPPGFTPLVLGMSTACLTGQEVYSISAALGHDPNSLAVGYIREASYTDIGTITDVLTSVPHYPGSSGAAVIRKADNAIVAMVQYDFAQNGGALSVGPSVVPTPEYSGGVSANLIRAFMALAGTASAGGAPVTGAYYFPGATTYPTLRDNFALGIMKPAAAGEAPPLAAVPLMAAGVQPQLLPVGTPAYGSLVYSPDVTWTATSWGTVDVEAETFNAGISGYLDITEPLLQAFDAEYVRAPVPYVRAETLNGTFIYCNTNAAFDATTGFFDLAAWAGEGFSNYKFTISTDSNSVYHYATNIIASASGWVSFNSSNAKFSPVLSPTDVEPLIADPSYPNTYLLSLPYASTDFILQSASPNYAINYGTPGGPLRLSMNIQGLTTTKIITFQWDGYSQTTLDPVSFQVALTVTSNALPQAVSGQVQFNYGVLPGTWAGNPWLAANQLTSDPDAGTVQLIEIVDQPRMNESIYFGTSTFQSTAQLVRSVPVPSAPLSSLQNRVVAPRRLPSGALPNFTVTATFCTYDGTTFQYVILEYGWEAIAQRIASLNGSPVGVTNLNTPSLTDAIVATGSIYGTQLAPKLLSAVSIVDTATAAPVALTLAQRNAILTAYVNLGPGVSTLATAPYLPATSKFLWTPSADYYASSLLYVQPTPNPREVFNYSSVVFQITFSYLDILRDGDNNGIIVLQLAAADSTSLLTQFADSSSPTCVLIYYVDDEVLGDSYVVEYRNGYGGSSISTTDPQQLIGDITVNGVLAYNTASFTQRPNVLVVGRPPRAGNGPDFSPYSSNPGVLVPFEVELGQTRVADMRSVVQAVPPSTTQYAVTTERNVARPSFFNPVALKSK